MTGIDGYDWSVLGGNPAPGDPDVIRSIALQLRDLADGVDTQNRLLRSVGGDSESIWVGPAADAFRPHVDKLPGQMDKLTRSYRDAGDALDGYWPALRSAQQLAVQALFKAQAALQQLAAAKVQVAQAGQAASAAADAYNRAATAAAAAPPDPSGVTASHLASLQSGYQAASSQLSAANAALAAAQASLQAARNQAETARTNAGTAAGRAASAIMAASHAGIHNPHHGWFSSLVDDVEGVVEGGVHWVEHHAGAIETGLAVVALGPAGLLLTADGRHLVSEGLSAGGHLVSEGLEAIEPGLKIASGVLGITSTVLAVAGLVLAPVGLGEVIDLANEAVMGLKTADDGLLLAAGDKEAEAALAEDALGLATGGMGRVLGDIGETASAAGEAEQALGEVSEANKALDSATSAFEEAGGRAAAAGAKADQAASDSELLTNLAADARSEGNVVDAESFASQASAKLDERASALAGRDSALSDAHDAEVEATVARSERSEALGKAESQLEDATRYQVTDVKSGLSSFVGKNNLDRLQALRSDAAVARAEDGTLSRAASYKSVLLSNMRGEGLSGSYPRIVVRYYSQALQGAPNEMGQLGANVHRFQLVRDGYEVYHGIGHAGESLNLASGN